ncbi:uncharacterized protein CMU_003750 [Cryptosporidium muris RN66]|uniref:Uncharacterized protein n=1 Tax=Cryptosporidium muris (strain RN66) TaxID=441375 RepID=B6AJZ5_CRYMR|nr:uncharacterized protein CMU_003750 [Cryptosporidium muris RN66]EEA08536.1 hypothetical protein, conserved [Cryptosporidium muris RN66]|eukprot:XP_002142885.1 hypothetical protein [Cryptosporidium muris RN66]
MTDSTRINLMTKLGITLKRSIPSKNNANNNSETLGELQSSISTELEDEFTLKLLSLEKSNAPRLKYLRKLSYLKIWVPSSQRPPKHQTAIIFDWDDTLLCTTYINRILNCEHVDFREQKKGNININDNDFDISTVVELPKAVLEKLELIQKYGKKLLESSLELGHVFIITNAIEGWVEYSANKYLPKLVPTLSKVIIISARSKYEMEFPGGYYQWKFNAFLEVQKKLNSEIITNLISIGDSVIEMEAVHILGKEFSESLVKTIKMRESPTPDEIAKQLALISSKFEDIYLNARNLKIVLEKKVVKGY